MPRTPAPIVALLGLVLLGTAVVTTPAHAQVRRCVKADGAVVFTDHQCSELGAEERAPPHAPQAAAGSNSRAYRGCSRTVQDLIFEMTTAFDTHDVNRLAGVYHWAGMAGSTAYTILARLDAMVQRPLVDVVPVMPRSVAQGENEEGLGTFDEDGHYTPQTSVRSTPVAVRVEQTLANSITPSQTVFGLRRHLGCWWVQL